MQCGLCDLLSLHLSLFNFQAQFCFKSLNSCFLNYNQSPLFWIWEGMILFLQSTDVECEIDVFEVKICHQTIRISWMLHKQNYRHHSYVSKKSCINFWRYLWIKWAARNEMVLKCYMFGSWSHLPNLCDIVWQKKWKGGLPLFLPLCSSLFPL
jgi:hypothetical protein